MTDESTGGRTELAEVLFRIGAVRFGRFTLTSGKSSPYYLDLRAVPSDPDAFELAVRAYVAMARAIGEDEVEAIAGVATAGVALSAPLAYLMRKPMVYVRKEERAHGLGRQVEGAVRPGWRTLLVDDLVTTGGSLVTAVEALRKVGCEVKHAAVLVDRLEGGKQALRSVGVALNAFTDVRELVGTLYGAKKVTKTDFEAVLKQVGG